MEGGDEEVLPPIGLYMAEWFFAAFLVDLRSIWLTEMERDQYYDSGNVPTITTTTEFQQLTLAGFTSTMSQSY